MGQRVRHSRWLRLGAAVVASMCAGGVGIALQRSDGGSADRNSTASAAIASGTIAFSRGGPGEAMLPGEIGVPRGLGIFTVDLATGMERQVTSGDALAQDPAWSSDGRAIAFSRYELRGDGPVITVLATIRPDGRRVRQLVDCPPYRCVGDGGPAFSRDGSKVAFRRSTRHGGKIFVARANGREVRTVSRLRGLSVYSGPTWSRDGSRIAFSAYRHGGDTIDLYTIGANGRGLHRIRSCKSNACTGYKSAAWSPASEELAAERRTDRGIQLIHPDGTVIRSLTDCEKRCEDSAPSWSPDGRYIAFVRKPARGRPAVFVLRRDGTGLRRVTRRFDYVCCPSWRP